MQHSRPRVPTRPLRGAELVEAAPSLRAAVPTRAFPRGCSDHGRQQGPGRAGDQGLHHPRRKQTLLPQSHPGHDVPRPGQADSGTLSRSRTGAGSLRLTLASESRLAGSAGTATSTVRVSTAITPTGMPPSLEGGHT